jgi:hypothetical protein
MQTLVDCGCETKVHADGSGVEVYFCPLHEAAPEMLKALEAVSNAFYRESLVEHRGDVMPKVWAAIRKAKGE